MGVERLNQLCEVGERSGQPIDLIDDEDDDPSGQCNRKDVKPRISRHLRFRTSV